MTGTRRERFQIFIGIMIVSLNNTSPSNCKHFLVVRLFFFLVSLFFFYLFYLQQRSRALSFIYYSLALYPLFYATGSKCNQNCFHVFLVADFTVIPRTVNLFILLSTKNYIPHKENKRTGLRLFLSRGTL